MNIITVAARIDNSLKNLGFGGQESDDNGIDQRFPSVSE